ncbi:MAG: adenylate kinase [Bacteroidales bacterium]|nr:adenylate kinase [Bacteroidales bacterium]MCF8405292.1 adenylate kinase [Bacteroidales bacterium]
MFNFILFGPPGSGKGTQSIKIAEKYNFAHISTGDIFRKNIREKTALGLKVQGIIEKGELVPDELLLEILEDAMNSFKNKKGFVFDGFPRTLNQADDLEKILWKKNEKVSLVVALEVNDDEIIGRLLKRAELEGRKDDTKDVIENRISIYNNQTQPLIDYYMAKNTFTAVNGIGGIDDIFNAICDKIDQKI